MTQPEALMREWDEAEQAFDDDDMEDQQRSDAILKRLLDIRKRIRAYIKALPAVDQLH